MTEHQFRAFDQQAEPGPQESACPESEWLTVDALLAVGLVASIVLIVLGVLP